MEHFASAPEIAPLVDEVKKIWPLPLFFATFFAFVLVVAPLAFRLVAALLVASLFHVIGFLGLFNVIHLVAVLAAFAVRAPLPITDVEARGLGLFFGSGSESNGHGPLSIELLKLLVLFLLPNFFDHEVLFFLERLVRLLRVVPWKTIHFLAGLGEIGEISDLRGERRAKVVGLR